MARSYSNRGRFWRGRRANSAYLVAAVIVFGLIVFVLFRGGSSEPQQASAGENPPAAGSNDSEFVEPNEPLVVQSDPQSTAPAPVSGQPEPETGVSAEPLQSVVPVTEAQPDPHAEAEAAIAAALALGRSQPGKVLEVRDKLNAALDMSMSPEQRILIKDKLAELAKLAQEHYDKAQEHLKEGDWTSWGEELNKMDEILRQLVELAEIQQE